MHKQEAPLEESILITKRQNGSFIPKIDKKNFFSPIYIDIELNNSLLQLKLQKHLQRISPGLHH